MRKFLLFIMVLLSVLPLSAVDSFQELILETSVPENYGIHVPDEALKLDQFVFEFETDNGAGELLTDSRFSIGSFDELEMQSFTLLYYGNLSTEYSVEIRSDSGDGFVYQERNADFNVPVNISFSEPDEKPEDIEITEDEEYAVARVTIPPRGPRRGVEVVSLDISWNEQRDLYPGRYELVLNIQLSNNL